MGYDSPLGGCSTVIKDVIALLPREPIFAVFSSRVITAKHNQDKENTMLICDLLEHNFATLCANRGLFEAASVLRIMYGNKEENECSFVSSMKTVFVAFSRVIRLKVASYFRHLFLTSYTKINPKHSEFLKKLTSNKYTFR